MRISAVLIVRDEARCLARCLESVRPVVDEIVVTDTGSTDDSPDIGFPRNQFRGKNPRWGAGKSANKKRDEADRGTAFHERLLFP